jgi:hypothetical protein
MRKKSKLLKLLRRDIKIYSRAPEGLCMKIVHLWFGDVITNEEENVLFTIIKKHKPKSANKVYWWPHTTMGNIKRWLFVTKLIIIYKLKGE